MFLSLPSGMVTLARVAGYIPSFVAIFHKYFSFFVVFLKKIKPISNLLTFSFSLSQVTVAAGKNNGFCNDFWLQICHYMG